MCMMLIFSCLILPGKVGATPLAPFIDLQEQGLTLTADGEGLQGWDGSARNLTVTVGGNVRFALLYWNGSVTCETNTIPCSYTEPFGDQQVVFNGMPITGTVIGTETEQVAMGNPRLHIGYFADVTSIVSAAGTGTHNFSFADDNLSSNLDTLNGVSLMVAYTDASNMKTYRVLVWDGLDFANASAFAPGENRVTDPVNFNHGINTSARVADLYIFNGGSLASLPDNITISNNPTIFNSLDSSSGNLWDSDTHSINIPAGVGTTTVQLNSGTTAGSEFATGCARNFWINNPDEWAAAGLSPNQTVGSVFSGADPSLASLTLLQALQGGNNYFYLNQTALQLIQEAIIALLNASHPGLNYPFTPEEIIAEVNAALASNNYIAMRNLIRKYYTANNFLPCEFNEPVSDTILWQVAALRVEQVDNTQPSCNTMFVTGPPAQANTTIQDTGSGLAEILVTKSENADTVVPPFTVGTTDPVTVTSTKIDQSQMANIEIRLTDLGGNMRLCEFSF